MRFLSTAVMVMALFGAQALAQEDVEGTPPEDVQEDVPVVKKEVRPQSIISTNPLTALVGAFYFVEYERVLAKNLSFFFAPTYGFTRLTNSSGDFDYRLSGSGANFGVRFYLESRAPAGYFVSPRVHVSSTSGGSLTDDTTLSLFSIGTTLIGGYALLLGDVVHLSVGLGGGTEYVQTITRVPGELEQAVARLRPLFPMYHFNFGIAFQ